MTELTNVVLALLMCPIMKVGWGTVGMSVKAFIPSAIGSCSDKQPTNLPNRPL